jgi:LysR family glycine cleavage system transcriptional activator
MSRRLPPLSALRAFEAAARHLSFTRAAAELGVTQAAISHQVKLLEDQLG